MSTTKKRPPRAMYVTRASLERAPAEEILKAFKLVGDEVVRRIRNYGENADTPGALLDGIQFAGAAKAIQMGFTHNVRTPYDIYSGESTLIKIMSRSTWVETSDDDYGVDDEDGDDA